jgi:DNA-binding response OmpR family regulator
MSLKCLVLCSDEKILRILRRVLSDLEIEVEHCSAAELAVQKLTRQRFEAVIVDSSDHNAASEVLRSARFAPCNKRAVAVAVVDTNVAVRTAFDMGAHFVLFKPLFTERAKASFRAVRALMKRERRRNARLAVEIPVSFRLDGGAGQLRATTIDLGEGGIAVQFSSRPQNIGSMVVQFVLPGTPHAIDCIAEVAWENGARQVGVRFVDLLPETRDVLKSWLESRSPEFEKDDPPAQCKLADLSPGGCYLEIASPFPIRTRVILAADAGDERIRAEGIVRLMHPELGMGVEFVRKTSKQREHVQGLLRCISQSQNSVSLMVEPEGLETTATACEQGDALLDFFQKRSGLSAEEFHTELRKWRSAHKSLSAASS